MSEAGDPGRATKYVDILPCGCRIVDDCKLHGPDSIALAALQKERDEAVAMINSASRNPVGFGDFINRQIEQERDGARVGGLQGRQPRHRGGGAVTAPTAAERRAAAWNAHLAAMAPVEKAYVDAVAPALKAYLAVTEAAEKAYKDATEAAEKAYKDATEPARKVYIDALRATEEEP